MSVKTHLLNNGKTACGAGGVHIGGVIAVKSTEFFASQNQCSRCLNSKFGAYMMAQVVSTGHATSGNPKHERVIARFRAKHGLESI